MGQVLLNRLKLMGIFCHVVESGSMKEAAKKLGISPPAVSQFINQLESELNTTLLYRSTRKISTSEAGEQYYHQGKKMLQAAEAADDIIQQSKSSLSGNLRIALPVGLAAKPIASALFEMLEKHKDLKLTIIANDNYIDLIQERIDIVVDCGQPTDSNYIYHSLGKCDKHIYASPAYLKKHGTPIYPEDLKAHAWLGLGRAEAKGVLSHVNISHKRNDRFQYTPDLRITFNDLNSLISHVQLGYGIAVLPTIEITHLIESGELIPLLPDWKFDNHEIFALTRSKKYPYKVKAALSAMKEYFGKESYETD